MGNRLVNSKTVLVSLAIIGGDSVFDSQLKSLNDTFQLAPQVAATDPLYANQSSQLTPIGIEQAWDVTRGSSQVIVAVIDDAIDIRHPDLQANLIPGKDFVDNDDDPSPSNNSGCEKEDHGTSMAGIIGAVGNNSIGIAGINWTVKIMPLRIGCAYNDQREKQAIEYAIANGAQIINSSYGAPVQSRYEAEIKSLFEKSPNVLWVTAAGNHHTDNNNAAMYPANMDLPNHIAVAASDNDNRLSDWSQYGSTSVDLAAPGVKINTTRYSPGEFNPNGNYEQASGTSPATAIVSGVAALLKAKDLADGRQDFSAADIKAALLFSVTPLKDATAKLVTDGVVHARNALDTLDRLGPVMVIKKVEWDDGLAGNHVIDSGENGTLTVSFENIGTLARDLSLVLRSNSPGFTITSDRFTSTTVSRGNRISATFPIFISEFSGWKQFEIVASFTASGANGSISQQRRLNLASGTLKGDGAWINDTLQRDAYDEIHAFHTTVPSGYDKVAFEIEYEVGKDRDIGLAAKPDIAPLLYFGSYLGGPYKVDTSYKMDTLGGLERVLVPFGTTLTSPRTVHAIVFNTPDENIATPYSFNRSYRIRTCWLSSNDSNQPPSISITPYLEVDPGSKIRLQASVSDIEGEAIKYWWDVPAVAAKLTSELTTLTPTFTAPQTGDFIFTLHASDATCHYKSAQATVHVRDANDLVDGLQVFPPTYETYEGSSVNTRIQASNGGATVRDLHLISAPQGVQFDESSQFLTWDNARPTGEQTVTFATTTTDGKRITGGMKIIVKSQSSSSSSGGGCVIGGKNELDPTLPMLVLLSSIKIFVSIRFKKSKRTFITA